MSAYTFSRCAMAATAAATCVGGIITAMRTSGKILKKISLASMLYDKPPKTS